MCGKIITGCLNTNVKISEEGRFAQFVVSAKGDRQKVTTYIYSTLFLCERWQLVSTRNAATANRKWFKGNLYVCNFIYLEKFRTQCRIAYPSICALSNNNQRTCKALYFSQSWAHFNNYYKMPTSSMKALICSLCFLSNTLTSIEHTETGSKSPLCVYALHTCVFLLLWRNVSVHVLFRNLTHCFHLFC